MNEYAVQQLAPEEFPPLLREIPDAPEKLFLAGTLPSADITLITIIGSRRHSHYGKEACEKIIADLAGAPVAIVSGLALGIDAIAHTSAIRAGLPTIAVPGSGLLREAIYPSAHKRLAEEIVGAGGALLSEFEPDFRATPWAFPQRNRIMAGMAHATVIVEAQEKSGTLITGRLALDYNRDVFVVPGSIFSEQSRGALGLLKHGAHPITSGRDILDHLNLLSGENKLILPDSILDRMSPEEMAVFRALAEPLAKDELLRALDLPVHRANTLLSAMEIKGLIKEYGGKVRRM